MHDAIILYRPSCPYCQIALKTLKTILPQKDIQVIDVTTKSNEFVHFMNTQTHSSKKTFSVPQIFLQGEYIGGNDELQKRIRSQSI